MPKYLKAIVDAAQVVKGNLVLEVGPGKGALTRELLARGARVIAVEKDRDLIPLLSSAFAGEIASRQLTLIEGDIRDQNLKKIGLQAGKYALVANIPYYITGLLVRLFLTHAEKPSSMTLLVQKEVAERIAKSKKESLLSLSVKAYGVPKYVMTVPKGAFTPMPTVDSAILYIGDVSGQNFKNAKQEKAFFELIKAGFGSKRKRLMGNLSHSFDKKWLSEAFLSLSLNENVRAEDVPLESWLKLSKKP